MSEEHRHPWDTESLFAKALLYNEKMEACGVDDPHFGLWSTFCVELLCRAVLAKVSPTLLAESNWRNLYYALGHPATAKKFSPSSVSIGEVLDRLTEIIPEFTNELKGFALKHMGRRNAELHTGEQVFASTKNSDWLPNYYKFLNVALGALDRNLEDFVDDSERARELIDAYDDAAAKSIEQDIKAHKKVWEGKDVDERKAARATADAWATRNFGHRTQCPSCECTALLHGTPSGPVSTEIDKDSEDVIQKQTMFPSSFECVACSLKISGLSKLSAAGLGDAYTATSRFTAAEYFELYTQEEVDELVGEDIFYDEDFNE